jgi:hypothetical protein
MTTAKRWLGTLARHYPSLLVSGVCHKALGEIEELEAWLQDALTEQVEIEVTDRPKVHDILNTSHTWRERATTAEAKLATITTTLNHYAASDGLLAPLAAAVLREIEETK